MRVSKKPTGNENRPCGRNGDSLSLPPTTPWKAILRRYSGISRSDATSEEAFLVYRLTPIQSGLITSIPNWRLHLSVQVQKPALGTDPLHVQIPFAFWLVLHWSCHIGCLCIHRNLTPLSPPEENEKCQFPFWKLGTYAVISGVNFARATFHWEKEFILTLAKKGQLPLLPNLPLGAATSFGFHQGFSVL
jgi:hypothetical protein